MSEPKRILRATHSTTKQTSSLSLEPGQTWEVGRQDGSLRMYRWNIEFDPALSREHFRLQVLSDFIQVEATKNRHPILFEGEARPSFSLLLGQQFSSAHTLFEFDEFVPVLKSAPVADSVPTTDLDLSLDILSMTAVLAILLEGGVSYGRIFQQLQQHQSPFMAKVLKEVERAVVLDGLPLSKALTRQGDLFSRSYIGSIELGESTDLARAARRLYQQLAADYRRRRIGASEEVTALAHACRDIAEVLTAGHPTARAFELAGKASSDPQVSLALLDLTLQLEADPNLLHCKFDSMFLPIFPSLLAAHHSQGHTSRAFLDLAEILQGAPSR